MPGWTEAMKLSDGRQNAFFPLFSRQRRGWTGSKEKRKGRNRDRICGRKGKKEGEARGGMTVSMEKGIGERSTVDLRIYQGENENKFLILSFTRAMLGTPASLYYKYAIPFFCHEGSRNLYAFHSYFVHQTYSYWRGHVLRYFSYRRPICVYLHKYLLSVIYCKLTRLLEILENMAVCSLWIMQYKICLSPLRISICQSKEISKQGIQFTEAWWSRLIKYANDMLGIQESCSLYQAQKTNCRGQSQARLSSKTKLDDQGLVYYFTTLSLSKHMVIQAHRLAAVACEQPEELHNFENFPTTL